jgi:hypothetical protein
MVVVFAKNQTLVAIGNGPVTVFTDPVPMGEFDRLSSIANVHNIETNSVTGAPQIVYTAQLSNDGGQNYVDSSTVTETILSAGVTKKVGAVNAALVRFRLAFSNSSAGGTDVSCICFDLHVDFEKA